MKKWLVAMKREDFIPKKHSRICGRHFLPSAYYPFSRMLLPTAIPYTIVFNFPTHLQQKPIIERRPLKRIEPPAPTLNKIQEEPPSKKVKLPPSEKGLMSIIEEQEKKIKTLQQNTPMNDIWYWEQMHLWYWEVFIARGVIICCHIIMTGDSIYRNL